MASGINNNLFSYVFELPDYFIKPFEKELVKLQLGTIFPTTEIHNGNVEAKSDGPIEKNVLKKLAFFDEILIKSPSLEERITTDQSLLEKTATIVRRSKNERDISGFMYKVENIKVNRKESQYLTHSIHPYKGRFYPQMIRALINFSMVKKGDVILDPFCGCGTTLLESFLMGINSIGIDLHPLACYIAKTKVDCLSINPLELQPFITNFFRKIPREGMLLDSFLDDSSDQIELPQVPDIPNVDKWFTQDVLRQIRILLGLIDEIKDGRIKDIANIALSSILRPVSNWDTRQVRVRLLKKPRKNVQAFSMFKERLWRIYLTIHTYHELQSRLSLSSDAHVEVLNEDCRKMHYIDTESVDAVITSPPYAMALPYIDTDRLSLFMLGFVNRKSIHNLIESMIGNREISPPARRRMENEFIGKYGELKLPCELKELIMTILKDNKTLSEASFRRKNMAALLYKYFFDMNMCLDEIARVLKNNRYCTIIIGNNFTLTGKKRIINVKTDEFLKQMMECKGFQLIKMMTKDLAPTSPPPLSKIRCESVLIFKKGI